MTPAQIAADVGVTAPTVVKATAPFGPFPPTRDFLDSAASRRARWSPQDAERWIKLRYQRVSMTQIVRAENAARTQRAEQDQPRACRRTTETGQDHSPTTASGASGAADRQARSSPGRALQTTPATTETVVTPVTVDMVRAATTRGRPFPSPLLGPPGLIGIRRVAELARVSQPTIAHRLVRGQLPPPRVVTASGKPKWHPDDVTAWLQELDLPVCPVCGAKARRLDRHRTLRHPPPAE